MAIANVFWDCGKHECYARHKTREEAISCADIYQYAYFTCEVCGASCHRTEKAADNCCNVEFWTQIVRECQEELNSNGCSSTRWYFGLAAKELERAKTNNEAKEQI